MCRSISKSLEVGPTRIWTKDVWLKTPLRERARQNAEASHFISFTLFKICPAWHPPDLSPNYHKEASWLINFELNPFILTIETFILLTSFLLGSHESLVL